MTTNEIIKKALDIIGNRLVVDTVYVKTSYWYKDGFLKPDIDITVFYKTVEGITNFCVTAYNAETQKALDKLFIDLEGKMVLLDLSDSTPLNITVLI